MKIPLESLQKYSITVLGQGSARILSFAMTVWIARTIGVEGFGLFSLAYVVMTLVAQIPQVLDSAFVRAFVENTGSNAAIFNGQFCMKVVWLVVALFSALLVGLQNSTMGLAVAAGGFWGFYSGIISYYQAHQRYKPLSFYYFLSAAVSLIAVGFVLAWSRTPTPLSLVTALASGYVLLGTGTGIFLFQKTSKPFWNPAVRDSVYYLFRFGGWLLLANVCFVLFQRGDMLLLSRFADPETLGRYAVAIRTSSLMAFLMDPIHPLFLPKSGTMLKTSENFKNYQRRSLLYGLLTFVAAVVLILFRSPVITLLFGSQYLGSAPALLWLLCGWIVAGFSMPLHYIFYAEDRPSSVFWMMLIMLAVLGAAGLALVPRFHDTGAAFSVLLGYFAGLLFVLKKYMKAPLIVAPMGAG